MSDAPTPEEQYSVLEEEYADKLPKNWEELTHSQKLEWFAHRILLDKREEIRQEHGNEAARDWGFMSDYQIERRRRREVQSRESNCDDVPPGPGVFSRTYVNKDELLTGRNIEPKDTGDGQKNT